MLRAGIFIHNCSTVFSCTKKLCGVPLEKAIPYGMQLMPSESKKYTGKRKRKVQPYDPNANLTLCQKQAMELSTKIGDDIYMPFQNPFTVRM